MIGFSQSNDLTGTFPSNFKDRPMTDWSDPNSSSTKDFCDEIDQIMKHEHEDVILLDHSLSVTPLDLDLDSISDFLENPPSCSPSSFSQPLNINDLTSTFTLPNSTSQSNTTTTSAYSSLGISPTFTTLSLNPHPFSSFISSNNLPLPAFIQQRDHAILGTSYPFELQSNSSGPSDVKRFRSASMNEGPSSQGHQQQNKADPDVFDSYRHKSPNYVDPSSYQIKSSSSPPTTIDPSSTAVWPIAGCTRPASNSFSEVENQQRRVRLEPNLSSSFGGISTNHQRNPTRFSADVRFQPQTLYSINQPTNEESTPPTRKRLSLVNFPVEEIKDDPNSPNGTIEQQSEPDLWSDIEQNSSEHIHDNEMSTSEDELAIGIDPTLAPDTNASSSASLFWQYNVQSKGPKTKRILYLKERDPHLYREFSDPVYQIKLTQTKGQTFNKLRKGDGNDVTPNPMKLYQLGKQIRDLSDNATSVYHGIYHVEHHSSTNDTAEVKKEKNKIASRACRLRKKAQHEANKLKLHGLNEEHKSLLDIIASMKLKILKHYQNEQSTSSPNQSFEAILDQLIATKYVQSVAGNADGFVQTIINDMECLYTPKQQRSHSLNT